MHRQAQGNLAACDVLILPRDAAQFGMFETGRLDEIEAAGYAAAREQLPSIRRAVERRPTKP
jgi:hypothetical protein